MYHFRMDSHFRSVFKALSWRFLATSITVTVALIITKEIAFAAKIGAVDTLLKLFVYYMHERFWNNIKFGQAKPPEYEI